MIIFYYFEDIKNGFDEGNLPLFYLRFYHPNLLIK
jgi:hypothetical protein